MGLNVELVQLSLVETHPLLIKKREQLYERNEKASVDRSFPSYDWQRISYCFLKLKIGKSCLEVGPGRGYLTELMVRNKTFERVTAIDIVPRPLLPQAVDFRTMSVAELEFPDNHFDSVICMEVLEHLDDTSFKAAVLELRRVCRGQLMITVPFCEPMPSKYHLQKFTVDRIEREFPDAKVSILTKEPIMRVPWLLIEEIH